MLGALIPVGPEMLPDHGGGPIRVGTGIIVRSGSGMPPYGRPEVVTRSPLAVVPENEPGAQYPDSYWNERQFTVNGLRPRMVSGGGTMLGGFGIAALFPSRGEYPNHGQLIYLDLGEAWALGRVMVDGEDISATIFATGDSKAITGTDRAWFVPPLKRRYSTLMWKRRPSRAELAAVTYRYYEPETGTLSGSALGAINVSPRVLLFGVGALSGAALGGALGAMYTRQHRGRGALKGAAAGVLTSLVLNIGAVVGANVLASLTTPKAV